MVISCPSFCILVLNKFDILPPLIFCLHRFIWNRFNSLSIVKCLYCGTCSVQGPGVAEVKIYYDICRELVNLEEILIPQRTDWWVLVRSNGHWVLWGKACKENFCGLRQTNNSSNNRDLSRAYCVSGTNLSAIQLWAHLIFTIILWIWPCYFPHFEALKVKQTRLVQATVSSGLTLGLHS